MKMEEASTYNENLLHIFDEEFTTDELPQPDSSQLENQESRNFLQHANTEAKDINEEVTCDLCDGTFTYKHFNEHKKTERHRLARKNVKRRRKAKAATHAMPLRETDISLCLKDEARGFRKETYEIRFDIELPEQNQRYQNTLTTFLALRFSLSSDNQDLKISMNNLSWKEFGDIVIEFFNLKSFKVYAIQCKKIQGGTDITVSELSADKARFSLKHQCDILSNLRDTKNYDNTYFKLFTVSNLIIDNEMLINYDDVIDKWQTNDKETWKGRQLKVSLYNKKCLVNSTDDPDNICLFKMIQCNDELVDKDLNKFRLYVSQRKTESLTYLIRIMIEDKFDVKKDISNEMVKYVGEYFQKNKLHNFNFKMSKRDLLLKMTELILVPFVLLPESTGETRLPNMWDEIINIFDLTVIKNSPDVVKKIYSSFNYILKTKISSNMDTSVRSLRVDKDNVLDEAIKSEMFDGFVGTFKEVSLVYLYVILWKTELAPLILKIDNETNLVLVIKLINFLKSENISVKFILMMDFNIHPSYFPDNLKSFNSLLDLQKANKELLNQILQNIEILVFEFNVSLKELVQFNTDFLAKVTPDVLLNMCLGEFSFKNFRIPMTDDIMDNTLVFTDEMMGKLKKYLQNYDCLFYEINVKGNVDRIEIPPNI